jgi:transmembrane sensor
MISKEEQIRAAIAEQAGEWFVANDDGPLDAQASAALATWLRTSPIHIEEFLAVSTIARGLKEARTDAEYSLESILARARTADDTPVQSLWPGASEGVRGRTSGRWLRIAVAMAACAVLGFGLLLTWNVRPMQHSAAPERITALHFETGHGEQLTRRLADNSVVHLNTDSAVTVRYGATERLVMLRSGQADFEIAHEPVRAFRVIAGAAEVVDLGTKFDVRLERDSTVVTVVEGRVTVGPSSASQNHSPQSVQLSADQQTRVTKDEGPTTPIAVDALRTTAWLHRQIVFDHESLEHVAAEYNRYSSKPIEIAAPALRNLQISGVFATDDPAAFIAFLRSLNEVRVEVTETRIRVW